VDIPRLRGQLTRSLNKFQRGFDAFERNTGSAHRLAGSAHQAIAKRAADEDLTDAQEELWFGSISVGTPAKTFTVDFDTGSSDLFLPSTDCDATCDGHTLWDPTTSSTADDTNMAFSLAFGDGSTVNGTVFMDTVTVAGLTATGQAVGASTEYSTGFEIDEFPPDGLAGLAFPALSVFGDNDLFTTLVNEGQADPQFGVKLADSGSEITFGGVNSDLFTGDFANSPVVQDAFWQIELQGASAGGDTITPSVPAAIVDTGTTLVIGAPDDVAAIFAQVPGAEDASSTAGPGFFTVPCASVPTISLMFAGTAFDISPDILNLGEIEEGSSDCVAGLMAADLGFWVVGDVFLRNVYTSFNKGADEVGFATLA